MYVAVTPRRPDPGLAALWRRRPAAVSAFVGSWLAEEGLTTELGMDWWMDVDEGRTLLALGLGMGI